jgi:hypothetical protein
MEGNLRTATEAFKMLNTNWAKKNPMKKTVSTRVPGANHETGMRVPMNAAKRRIVLHTLGSMK